MANISGNGIKTLITNYKDNLGGATDVQIADYVNFLNQFFYNRVIAVNPNDYLSTRIIKTIADTDTYALPSDFKHMRVGGLYQVNTGTTYYALNFDGQTANFTAGETLTGGTSGATGTIVRITDYGTTGTIQLSGVSGTFADNETITSAGGSATANGTAVAFEYSDTKIPLTDFGASEDGYFTDLTNLNITPTPTSSEVLVMRYIPKVSAITSSTLSTETLIPTPDFDEFVRDAIDVYWNQWRQSPDEFTASQRATAALKDCLKNIRKSPAVLKVRSTSRLYL